MVCFVDVLRGPRFIRRDGLTRLIVDVCDVMKSVANGSSASTLTEDDGSSGLVQF